MDVITGNISSRGTKISGLISQSVLRGYSAYQIACQNGFSGSIEQWLYSLRGESIQFKSEGLSIYYKYESDPDWTLLVQIDQLLADYSLLDNKPSIGGVELNGNKTLDDLGIQAKGDYVEEVDGYSMVSDDEIERLSHVDNYDDSEIRQAIEAIVLAAVTGVKGVAEREFRKGNVTITPANIGLENVDNTHDADKDVLSAVQDSEGNVFGETYFNGVSESEGDVYLTRPDGTSEQMPVGSHLHDASEITTGTIDIARLPAAALERMIDVENRQARYALTKDQVQNGDTVRQLDTGVMYRVVDDTKLNKSDGYKEYTAGRASAVPWSGVEDKPSTFTPSAHTHTISEVTDIANASVAEAAKLKTPRTIAISGGATAGGVSFDGTGNVNLVVTELDATLLSGTADISITGNAATATQFARERTIEVTGKATAAPKVYDGRQNIALEITDLDAAEKVHKHTTADITDLDLNNINAKTAQSISDFGSDTFDSYADVWFSDDTVAGKPVHNQGLQYNPSRNILKAGTFNGDLDGTATSASALTTDAGGANQPVYFSNGVPVATTYELNKTVPADAVFTDTHHVSNLVVSGNFNGKTDTATALSNGNVHINHVENDTIRSSHRITGTGTTTVTTDEYGNIVVNSASTPYDSGPGISIADNIVTNTGVRSISESTTDGNITANINGTSRDIPVKGLKSAAFTESTDYATSNHKHSFSDLQNKPTTLQGYGITDAAPLSHEHDASSITSGTIDIARLPAAAVERLVVVANETARYALTTNDVQNGDTVQQEDTGVMYRVVDDTKLDRSAGYKEYTAGTASSVPWSGITGKPESFVPATHTHTSSDITDISTMTVGKAEQLANSRTIALTGAVTGSGSFNGSGDLSIDTTVNHTHDYAGASTPGGAANTALRLQTSAGSATNPVYFQNGIPVTTTYELNKTVPADAVFTDTHHVSTTVINSADDSTTESSRAITNGNVFINHIENGTVRASHRVEGTGNVSVVYNSDGDIIIHGADTVYQTLPNPYALSINGKTYDGTQAVDVGIMDVAHGGTGASSVDTAPTADSTKMVTSGGVYTALAGKSDTNHTHLYAGSSTSGGSATSAAKLDSDAGSSTQPVYFVGGKPTATGYSLAASVPANAVFTDTHYASKTVVAGADDATDDTETSLVNTRVFLNHIENGSVVSSHKIFGTGSASVTTDTSGNIIINAEDTKYTTLPNPYSLTVNGKSYDGSASVDVGTIDVAHGGTGNTSVDSEPTENSTKMVTSDGIYTALQGKANATHTHLYAGSSTAGGSATSAIKLDSNAGSALQPVYFSGGKPVATTYSLEASVPSNAVFTDTHYTSKSVVASADDAITDTSSALTNTHVFVNHVENGAVVSSHRISGTGATTVTTDSSGNILINSDDTKYVALPNPYSLSINGKTYDGSAAVDVGVIDVAHGGTGNSSVDTTPTEDSTKMVTSGGIYASLAGKADANHTHLYAGASVAGGSASSAVKLDSSAGTATNPVYFSGGKPVATTHSLNASVPADAVFTDTHYTSKSVVASANDASTDTDSALSNTHVFLNHVENNAVTASHRITGTGATTVTTDSSGNILINSTDTKYTELPNPESLIIQGNGTTIGTYKGDSEKTINITYQNVGAAASSHQHAWSDLSTHPTTLAGYGITDQVAMKNHVHDASSITSGVFDIARIPVSALERLHVVDNLAAMYQLTKTEVQIGDTVQCDDTKIMYRVVDDENLDNASGYKEYVAGSASSVPWSGVTGKPSTFAPSEHTHLYAGSASPGGSATTAEKLNPLTDAGSATNPVFFSGGKPSACTYSLNKTVPSDAVFTDTHYEAKNVVGGTASATADTSSNLSNGNVYINLVENGSVKSSHKISGSDAVSVTTDSSGNINISAHDTKYTGSNGIALSGTNFTNSGVRSVTAGATNGTINVNTNGTSEQVAVTGLGGAAYKAENYYALSSHTHNYAGSATAGGSATSAVALDSHSIGDSTQPVYFSSQGKPVAISYTIQTSVPANAVFTDTHYSAKNVIADSSTGTSNTDEVLGNGSVYLNLIENGGVRSSHKITGSGATSVTTDAYGNVIISSTDNDTKYTGSNGITLTGTNFTNSGVRAVSTGTSNGTIKVNTNGTETNVAVYGLGSAAYTDSTAYAASGHTHNYAGASTSGGSATSAVRLDSGATGSETKPIYWTSGGKPAACTYSLNKDVPANAVFTDTHYNAKLIVTNSSTSTSNTAESLSGTFYLNVIEDGGVRSSHKITAGSDITLVTDTSGNITISSSDTKYTAATAAPGKVATASAVGSSANYARQDHTHGIDLATGDNNGQVKIAGTNVSVKGLGSAAYTNSDAYATSGHTHTLSIATDTGTNELSLAASTKYKLTAGGKAFVFTTPANTWRGIQNNLTSDSTSDSLSAAQGKVLKGLVDGKAASNHTHTLSIATDSGTNELTLVASTKYKLTAGGKTFVFTMPGDTVYTHPTHTAYASGWYKITVNDLGHVTAATAVTKADITGFGISSSDHTHDLTLATDTGTSAITLAYGGKYKLTAGGKTLIFTMPASDNTWRGIQNNLTSDSTSDSLSAYQGKVLKGLVDGKAASNHTHDLTIASSDGTNALSMAANTKYILTAGGKTFIFTTPPDTNTWRGIQNNVTSDSTTDSLSAAQGKYLKGLVDGKAASGHTHDVTIATSTGTSALSLSANSKYVLTAGGKTFIFTTPPDTTYSSKAAASGGTDVSLVTTGEKYTWNNKSDLTIGTTSTTAAAGNHTHNLTIAADSGTNALTLAYGTKYKLTAGGKEFIFTMPASDNTNTHRPIQLEGTEILGNNTTALNFKKGTNISITNSSGTITIATTATKDAPYTSNPANVSTSASAGSSSNFARGDHVHAISLATGDSSGQVKIAGTNVTVKDINTAAYKAVSYFATSGAHTETKSEDTSQKIFLIGAQSQSSSGVKTFSDNEVYVTNGVLTTKSTQIGGTAVTLQYNSSTKSLDFVFA